MSLRGAGSKGGSRAGSVVSKRTSASSNSKIPIGEQFFKTAEEKHQKWRSLVACLWEFLSDHGLLLLLSISAPISSQLLRQRNQEGAAGPGNSPGRFAAG